MRISLLLFLFLTLGMTSCAQQSIPKVLQQLNTGTVDYIFAEDLYQMKAPIVLDAREKDEFEVSHLKNAVWVGYEDFNLDKVIQQLPSKEKPIVVYCAIGVRSEDIGEQLKSKGYTNIKNLYGGIFEWKNKGFPVYDENQHETEKVHAFNQYWSRFLTNGEKVF
jgi:rhodanese-related sulfurtransferase